MSGKFRWRPIDIALFVALALVALVIALGVFDGGWL